MALIGENLGFYYEKDKWLFKNVNIKIQYGEILGVSGYSGSGKTSLAKILANYRKPIEGKVTVDGIKPSDKGFQKVQLIYQHPEKVVNPKWKMKDVLTEAYTPDKELLDRFGIKEEWLKRWPIELSGGELQRFCIVRALHPETRYIIADEMTTMLDGITQAKIWHELIEICKERKIGLAVVSHEYSLLKRISDKIIVLTDINNI